MNDDPLLADWWASAARDGITARLQAIADEIVQREKSSVMGGVAHAPVVEVYAAKRVGRMEHVFFLFDVQFYHYAQSGSDYDTHAIFLGEATFDSAALVVHALQTAKNIRVHESQGSTNWYQREDAVREVRDAARAQVLDRGNDGS